MVVNPNIVLVAHNLGTDVTLTCSVVVLSILAVAALGLNGAYGLVEIPLVMAWALLGIYAELIVPQASIREAYSQTQLDGIRTGTLAAAVGIVVLVVHDTFVASRCRSRWATAAFKVTAIKVNRIRVQKSTFQEGWIYLRR
jgi:hypothetical protein